MRLVCAFLALGACSFDSSGATAGDGPTGAVDAMPGDGITPADGPDALVNLGPVHIPEDGQYPGSDDLTLTGTVTITTGPNAPSIDTTLPAGVVLDFWTQPCTQTKCPEVAVLHTHAFTVSAGATLRVLGTRPLAVVAGDRVIIAGLLDASARTDTPGGGGFPAALGPGVGAAGMANSGNDGGGGGAGYGRNGGSGADGGNGSNKASGGANGVATDVPELMLLLGGSGGGAGSQGGCSSPTAGGAGGGAVELFSTMSVEIDVAAVIDVGGGGGGGGSVCVSDDSAGAGGGSGGAIVLQAPLVNVFGTLAANGGGGGGGASNLGGGGTGQDATETMTAASGGAAGDTGATAGGNGGVGTVNAQGAMAAQNNGGGGGGAVGRIRILHRMPLTSGGTITPPASVGTY